MASEVNKANSDILLHAVFHSVTQALDVEGGTTQALDAEGGTLTHPYMKVLLHVQQHVREWRDRLLHKPLLTSSGALSYPKEIEVCTHNKTPIMLAFQCILASIIFSALLSVV